MTEKKFKRQNQHKNKRIPNKWRKPEGKHSDVRLNKKHAPNQPKAGYRTNKEIRGLHPSGYRKVYINRPIELDELESESEAAIIKSNVGGRKRQQILEKAEELEIKILNTKPEEGDNR